MAPTLFGVQPKDALTIVALVVSIGLGLWNLRATKRIRSGTIIIEELRSQVRDPIHKKLDELLTARASFATLVKPNGFKIDELRGKISDVVSKVEFSLLDLMDLLSLANASDFTVGKDWNDAFDSRVKAIQLEAGKLTAPKASGTELGASMNAINIAIEKLNQELRGRLEREVRLHLPS